ncbi:response regulator [Streptococcus criceti]|uniref:DNA-binding response regulator n=1 Tax=Streptococcus criceti HS-6 TaxID=873449 RepID=G5JPH6_STRCG|nr:response regulator transcription factor [Streptococcus criceti]EHI74159.1 DNA-binding response regulator [Streptococcus criceti HS-6]SUN43258.1 response regulator [Streptococcus criceti]
MTLRILLAEDEEQLARVYQAALEHQGYQVDHAPNGQEAVDLSRENPYDVIILDIMMPIKTGLEALSEIRALGDRTHIIMLTAMSEINDRVTGLDAGADEYLTKPISLKELLARLRSMERRLDGSFTTKILKYGSVTLNVAEQEMTAENTIRLAGKENKLMEFFMLNPAKMLSTSEIFQQVWSKDEDGVTEDYVYVYVSYLRQKLKSIQADLEIVGEKGGSFELIEAGDRHV